MICRLLSLLKLHRLDCENCNPSGSCRGEDMRKRLEELSADLVVGVLQQERTYTAPNNFVVVYYQKPHGADPLLSLKVLRSYATAVIR